MCCLWVKDNNWSNFLQRNRHLIKVYTIILLLFFAEFTEVEKLYGHFAQYNAMTHTASDYHSQKFDDVTVSHGL